MYGKTALCWNVPDIYDGSPEKVTQFVLDGNFDGVAFKAANGIYAHYPSAWPEWGQSVKIELVQALKLAGIKVYLWHFVYGYDSDKEAAIAITQCAKFNPDGYIWDVEGSFDKKPNAVSNAKILTTKLKTAFPDIPQALCWWALPKSPVTGAMWHPIPVAKEFMKVCDIAMPMEYWQGKGAVAAVSYLHKSIKIWREDVTDKPIAPIGRAYHGDGGYADVNGIMAFGKEVIEQRDTMGFTGCSWYSLDKLEQHPEWFSAVVPQPKWEGEIVLTDKEKLDRLVEAHKTLFPELE